MSIITITTHNKAREDIVCVYLGKLEAVLYKWHLECGWEVRLERQKGAKEFGFYNKCDRSH